MARHSGSKQKLQRQIGEDLGLKVNALKTARRLAIRPGQHGVKTHRKMSDYALQLREKQKLKYIYGILERQLRKIFEEASKNPVATGTALLSLLERRLDNVVYRASFTLTRASARQLVAHDHFLVNGKKMNIPSYTVKMGDVISMKKSKTAKIPQVFEAIEEERPVPNWLEVKGTSIKVVKLPVREDIVEKIDEQLIVEYYNR
ncbi:MAG: 30S ribosomal protein S4 [Candidatus Pacebacteria bacterium]|jgi:small subunit ribosomal protein S4|nr:30S ribosomal protein S4 [Candidatus Paceibacterota bacterium]